MKTAAFAIGGAGSIGKAVSIEIFKRNPKTLHVVDISENNTVELVRDIRSNIGYGTGDFRTFAIDCGSIEFEAMIKEHGPYDYVFNLSALKHVRSEKDPFYSYANDNGEYFQYSKDSKVDTTDRM